MSKSISLRLATPVIRREADMAAGSGGPSNCGHIPGSNASKG